MHIEKLLVEQTAILNKLREDLRISERLAENSVKLDEIKELLAADRQTEEEAKAVAATLKAEVDRLKAANQAST